VIDGQPARPDFVVKFPFDLTATRNLSPSATTRGEELSYTRELLAGQSVFTELTGFCSESKDFDIRVENRKLGAGVRVKGDQPLWKVVFWSIRTVLSPEAYINMQIEPGLEFHWKLTYDFYIFAPSQ
jgi:hypothetical protein